ncbi:beta-1,3-glucan-binding protein-like [Lineus longissimus]|uniref:beta-1,3-glucan-binding protein-like n=1 Tax=Lineus longissimus TaxID=88925 RepID=UPI00315C84A9
MSMCAVHYSINKPLTGVGAGDFNFDITTKTGGAWVHQNRFASVSSKDIVYYWIYSIKDGAGYQVVDLKWHPTIAATVPTPTVGSSSSSSSSGSASSSSSSGSSSSGSSSSGSSSSGSSSSGSISSSSGSSSSVSSSGASDIIARNCTTYPCLIFADEFDTLNLDIWEHEITMGGGGNWEFQYYTNNRSNSYVRDGNLYLKPTLTSDKIGEGTLRSGTLDLWGAAPPNLCTGNAFYGCMRSAGGGNILNPIQSARIRSIGSFSFRYGKVEIEAKMPTGDWIWPAIWLLPKREVYGKWPASGEIDMVEARGNGNLKDSNGKSVGADQVGSTMHWGPYWPQNAWPRTHASKNLNAGTYGSGFHKYGLEWDETDIRFFLDGEEILKVDPGANGFWSFGEFDTGLPGNDNPWQGASKMAPFDQEFYFIMNVAVGGTNFFSDSFVNSPYPKPWRNDASNAMGDFWNAKNSWYPTWNGEDAAMQVNYVRVWKMKP